MGDGTQRSLEGERHFGSIELDLDVPCPLQWGLFVVLLTVKAQPKKLAHDGTNIAKYRETVNMALEITFNVPFDGVHTPRTCLPRAVSVLLYNSPDKDWNHEEETKGWGFGDAHPCHPECR